MAPDHRMEIEFLRAKYRGDIPANTGWAEWKMAHTIAALSDADKARLLAYYNSRMADLVKLAPKEPWVDADR